MNNPLKKDLCIISPRGPVQEESAEAGTCSLNSSAKNTEFTLHIKNETLESEGNIYDQEDDEMSELEWLRLNNGDELEYLEMLDRKEEEQIQKYRESRLFELAEKRQKEQEELERQDIEDLQAQEIKQKEIYYKSEIKQLKSKNEMNEKELK